MYNYKAKVNRVIDGDTIIVDIDLGFGIWLRDQSIRLAKINAPELRGATLEEGTLSKNFLKDQILNKWITVKTQKDKKEKYGRWLGLVLLEEDSNLIDVNHRMVAEGYAKSV